MKSNRAIGTALGLSLVLVCGLNPQVNGADRDIHTQSIIANRQDVDAHGVQVSAGVNGSVNSIGDNKFEVSLEIQISVKLKYPGGSKKLGSWSHTDRRTVDLGNARETHRHGDGAAGSEVEYYVDGGRVKADWKVWVAGRTRSGTYVF